MVSVIIPTYNRKDTILRSIKSVLKQTEQDFEIIIVDDGSTDGTQDLKLEELDCRIRYFKLPTNKGACSARNIGIQKANGDYIAFQDSDDEWRADKLEKQLRMIRSLNADICFAKVQRVNSPNDNKNAAISSGIVAQKDVIENPIVPTPTILARKEVFLCSPFDENMTILQDYDWSITASRKYRFCFVDEILVDAYFLKSSITSSQKGNNMVESVDRIIDKNMDLCEKYQLFYANLLYRRANHRAIAGKTIPEEYLEIFKINRDWRCIIKYILARTGLISRYYYNRDKRNVCG